MAYASVGSYVHEHLSGTAVTAVVLQRDSYYPCPLRKLREGFDAWLRQEAGKIAGTTNDIPSSLDDLLNFGCLLRISGKFDKQGTNQVAWQEAFFSDDGTTGLQYLLQLILHWTTRMVPKGSQARSSKPES